MNTFAVVITLSVLQFCRTQTSNTATQTDSGSTHDHAAHSEDMHRAIAQSIAQATCTALGTSENLHKGYFSAVTRNCSQTSPSCNDWCRNELAGLVLPPLSSKSYYAATCYQALHIFENHGKNMVVYKYGEKAGCEALKCGPNFCCCRVDVYKN